MLKNIISNLILITSITLVLIYNQPCLANTPQKNKHFPLLIIGGHWSASPKANYSDLSRVCDIGFTHAFSYYNEGMFNTQINLAGAVNNAKEFSSTIKNNCPDTGIVMGIPRRWIYEERIDLIKSYVLELKANNITVDYWLSDEMIHQMTQEGLTLKEAEKRAQKAINAVKEVSNSPYIWIEPGNYNSHFSAILDVLNDLPAGIKSYDEYIITRTGRLSKSQKEFNSAINTLKRLKSKNNVVFPVCEINYIKKKNIAPTEEELATIAISYLMEGADGLIFYEERWTTPEILQSIKRISGLITYLNNIGIKNFIRTTDSLTTSWEAKSNKNTIKIILNTSNSNIKAATFLPINSEIIWPSGGKTGDLEPMELLVYSYQ